jgi:hypothetical protein
MGSIEDGARFDGPVNWACNRRVVVQRPSAPTAVRPQKSLIGSWGYLLLRAAIAAGIDAFADAYNADEPQSKLRHFLKAQEERKTRAQTR